MAHYLYGFTCAATVVLIGVYTGFLDVVRDASLFFKESHPPGQIQLAAEFPARSGEVLMFGQETNVNTDSAHASLVFLRQRSYSGLTATMASLQSE